MDAAITKILARTDTVSLPTIPQVLLDLIEAFQDGNIKFDELAGIIGQDAGLSSKVLAAVNSAFYQQWGKLTDLNRALVVLGLNTLKTITITTAVRQFFHQIPPSQHHFLDAVWHKSLICAHVARRLAILTGHDSPDLAYLTGLLHRLGQLVLLQCFDKEYSALVDEYSEDIGTTVEKKFFGASHNEVGAYLIETWKTHTFMADAVLYQHQPADAIMDSPQLVKLINLAAKLTEITTVNEQLLFEQAFVLFGLNQTMVEEMLAEMKAQVDALAGSLGLSTAGPKEPGDSDGVRKWLQSRQETKQRLADHVQNISLIGAIGQSAETPQQATDSAAAIKRDFAVLFGYREAMIYLYNPQSFLLEACRCEDSQDAALWASLNITLKENRSLAANALLTNQILDSYDSSLPGCPVVDLQICRLLGSEAMLAVPLASSGQRLGVIVAGIGPADRENIKAKRPLIALFALEAARTIQAQQNLIRTIQEGIEATHSQFEFHVKKISHEASNPLSIINNYLYLLGHKLDGHGSEEIEFIRDEIKRVGDLILRLSDTPEDAGSESQFVDINLVIRNLETLFQGGLCAARQIDIKRDLEAKLPLISTSRTKLKQILTNLIKNAAEALAAGGSITITTRDRVYVGNRCCVEIDVSDDGPGLPDAIKSQLFVPVSSSKGPEHSGLGLTIVKSLVDEMGGTITCRSLPKQGTVFSIFLPRKTKP